MLRRHFKIRMNIRGFVEDHHVIPRQFKKHPTIEKFKYDINASHNLILMPRFLSRNLRPNRIAHNGNHPSYNAYVERMLNCITHKKELDDFVDFLKIACRFRPHDIPWHWLVSLYEWFRREFWVVSRKEVLVLVFTVTDRTLMCSIDEHAMPKIFVVHARTLGD